jgi:hypothetical protein
MFPFTVPRRWGVFALFLAVTLLFSWYRHCVCFIWDDSANLSAGLAQSRWVQELHQAGAGSELANRLEHLWQDTFGHVSGGGYRPLATVYSLLTYALFLDPRADAGPSLPHLLFVGTIYGALAVCVFCLAERFTRRTVALFASFLVMASPPLAATAWVVMTGVQAIVPLLICSALLGYFKAREPGRHPWATVTVLAILFFGPWFREFLGIVPLLIGFLELERAWHSRGLRPTWWMAAAGLGLLQAIYPTFLMHQAFFPDLPVKPVFALGNLADSLSRSEIRWFASWHFLPLFPPTLLVLAVASALVGGLSRLREKDRYCGRWSASALACCAWFALVIGMWLTGWGGSLRGTLVCMGFALIGFWRASVTRREVDQTQSYVLPVWFLAAFLPMLRVFTEHIHFLYAMVPAAIIVAQEVEALCQLVWARSLSATDGARSAPESRRPILQHQPAVPAGALLAPRAGVLQAVLAVLLAIAAIDQGMNLIGARLVNLATYGGIQEVADWFGHHVPEGACVVSNVIHAEEIKWHSGEHFENYWTVAAGVCDGRRVVDESAKLASLLADHGDRPVYFLDVSYDYLPSQAGYHRHKFVNQTAFSKEFLGLVHRTRTRYFFVDPLRHLVARDYVPFLGAPDLVNDFYCGLPHHRWPFRYEVYADYRVYRVLR